MATPLLERHVRHLQQPLPVWNQSLTSQPPRPRPPTEPAVPLWLHQLRQVSSFENISVETGARDAIARYKEICANSHASPPNSLGNVETMASVSSLESSDAVLGTYDAELERAKRGNDEVLQQLMLEGMAGGVRDTGEVNTRLTQENLTVQEIMSMTERRPRHRVQDPALSYALDAISNGGATFDQEPSPGQTDHSVNRGRLQNVLYSPPPPRQCSLDMTAEHLYGYESPRVRTQAFVDGLDAAFANVTLSQEPPQAWSLETRPTEVFPQPAAETPVPEPVKPRATGRRRQEHGRTAVFSIPSPVTPIPDPVKGRETAQESPIRPCHTLRRAGQLGDNRRGTSAEKKMADRGSPAMEDCGFTRCELCLY